MARLYTIGHSTRSFEDLADTLRAHEIQTLVDIRAFPMSRRLPQFNRESLEKNLPAAGIRYVWMKALGGYRKKILDDSPNIASAQRELPELRRLHADCGICEFRWPN